jgi:hypothetical protein
MIEVIPCIFDKPFSTTGRTRSSANKMFNSRFDGWTFERHKLFDRQRSKTAMISIKWNSININNASCPGLDVRSQSQTRLPHGSGVGGVAQGLGHPNILKM